MWRDGGRRCERGANAILGREVFSRIGVAVYYLKVGRIPLLQEEEVIQNVAFVHE